MGRPLSRFPDLAPTPHLARALQRKARAWRLRAERYLTLRDFDVRPGYSGWQRAVDEVQRAYPQTKGWLLSCSASEGGWGRWVRHGGGPYYPGLERHDVSGGWAQFKPGTFAGFYRRAVDDVRSRGFRVKRLEALPDGWLSPLSQALAAAWGRVNGLSRHWVGYGCR